MGLNWRGEYPEMSLDVPSQARCAMFGWFKKKSAAPNGPDFSSVDSLAKAEAMFRRGELEKLILLPLEFGGQDIPNNYLFVPLGVANVKEGIDANVIGPLVEAGTVT